MKLEWEKIADEYLSENIEDDDRMAAIKAAIRRLPEAQLRILLTYADLEITATARRYHSSYRVTRRYVDKVIARVQAEVFEVTTRRVRIDAAMRARKEMEEKK